MLILFLSALVLSVGIALIIVDCEDLGGIWLTGLIMLVTGIVVTLVVICALVITPIETRRDIAAIQSVEMSASTARESASDIERAAMQQKIIECNQTIAKLKYYNSLPVIGDFYPDIIDELEPIR